jgi:hypothetical protein
MPSPLFPLLPFLLALWAALAPSASALDRKFPPGTGVIDVRNFGVKGDGKTDDTRAIQALIDKHLGSNRYLYFPAGTYKLTETLAWEHANGIRDCGLTLIGESRARTVLKLADKSPGFSKGAEKSLLLLYSQTDGYGNMNAGRNVPGQGKDNGNGNSAFLNSIANLTVDIGAGNPGAVGVSALINNIGRIRDVTVRSSDPSGAGLSGIDMLRGNPGPMLVKNVSIEGFDYGLRVDGSLGSITLEHVRILKVRKAGVTNCQNTLVIRDLLVREAPSGLENLACRDADAGMVSLIDAVFESAKGQAAVTNEGSLFIRNLKARGFRAVLKDKGRILPGTTIREYASAWKHGVGSDATYGLFASARKSLDLPVRETPEYFDPDPGHWAIVKQDGDPAKDDCDSIRAAFAGGKPVIFFQRGVYTCGETLAVPGHVRHILGDNAWLGPHDFKGASKRKPFLSVTDSGANLIIENVDFRERLFPGDQARNPGLLMLEHASPRTLVLNGVGFWGHDDSVPAYRARPGAGNLFIEDVTVHSVGAFELAPFQFAWARQFNPEGTGVKIINDGASLWILGLKTENPGPVLWARGGGETELLGGMVVPVNSVDSATPAFLLEESQASLVYAFNNPMPRENPRAWYENQVRETRKGETRSLHWAAVTRKTGNKDLHLPLYTSDAGWSEPVGIDSVETRIQALGQGARYAVEVVCRRGNEARRVVIQARDSASAKAMRAGLLQSRKSGGRIRLHAASGGRATGFSACASDPDCPAPGN